MSWIDPKKEADAWSAMEKAGFASGPEIIRKRGRSPADVLRESIQWRKQREEAGLPLNEDAPMNAQPDEKADNSEDTEAA